MNKTYIKSLVRDIMSKYSWCVSYIDAKGYFKMEGFDSLSQALYRANYLHNEGFEKVETRNSWETK